MALKSKKQKQFPETTIPLHRLLKFFECNCLSVFQTCNDTKQTRFRKLQTFSLLTNWQIGYKWPLTHNVSPFFQLRKYSTLNRDNFYLFHIHRKRNRLSFEKCKKNTRTQWDQNSKNNQTSKSLLCWVFKVFSYPNAPAMSSSGLIFKKGPPQSVFLFSIHTYEKNTPFKLSLQDLEFLTIVFGQT